MIRLKWKKVKGAASYVLYGGRCGKSRKMKRIASLTGREKTVKRIGGQKLKKGTYYRFMVIALNADGYVLSSSKPVYAATKGGKKGNFKRVATKAKGSRLTLRKGKTFRLAGKAVASGKVRKYRSIRYESGNPKIASVSKKGLIKAVTKGTCRIYVYAQDGTARTIKVQVR